MKGWRWPWRKLAVLAGLILLAGILRKVDFAALPSINSPVLWATLAPYATFLFFDALGWQELLKQTGQRVGLWPLLAARLSAEAVGQSIPSGSVLGEGVSLHFLATRSQVPPGGAIGSLLARRVLVFAIHGGVLVGVGVLVWLHPVSRASGVALHVLSLGTGIGMLLVSSLLLLACSKGSVGKRVHGWLLAIPFVRLRSWLGLNERHFQEVDQHLTGFLAMPRPKMVRTTVFFLLARLAESFETVVILNLLGAPVGTVEILCFENLLSLLRALVFFVPGGLGIQDVGYLAALHSLGVAQATSVGAALVLLKRIKEAVYITAGYLLLASRAPSAPRDAPGARGQGGQDDMTPRRPRVLFICGSLNQTTQAHEVARELTDCDHRFSPYYCDGVLDFLRRMRLLEFTILGFKLRARCQDYLERHALPVDLGGREGGYDLVVTCSDLVVPRNIRGKRVVLVQEGMLDPPGFGLRLFQRLPFLPLWLGGTSTTGLSGRYERFCVASEGYRDYFVANGVSPERIVVTGIPNFDDCRRYLRNSFPHHNYVLVCSSDARETFKKDDRRSFIENCLWIAKRRPLIFKLHPNEDFNRASAEIKRWAPDALIYAQGSAEEMIANCDVLITQYSSTAFVGLALGKEVHSYFDVADLRRLMPIQNGRAARYIAGVCRELLAEPMPAPAPPVEALAAATTGVGP